VNTEIVAGIRSEQEGLQSALVALDKQMRANPRNPEGFKPEWNAVIDLLLTLGVDRVGELLVEIGRLQREYDAAVDTDSLSCDILAKALQGPEDSPEYDLPLPMPTWARKAAMAIKRLTDERNTARAATQAAEARISGIAGTIGFYVGYEGIAGDLETEEGVKATLERLMRAQANAARLVARYAARAAKAEAALRDKGECANGCQDK
jgi:hypothetical protein